MVEHYTCVCGRRLLVDARHGWHDEKQASRERELLSTLVYLSGALLGISLRETTNPALADYLAEDLRQLSRLAARVAGVQVEGDPELSNVPTKGE